MGTHQRLARVWSRTSESLLDPNGKMPVIMLRVEPVVSLSGYIKFRHRSCHRHASSNCMTWSRTGSHEHPQRRPGHTCLQTVASDMQFFSGFLNVLPVPWKLLQVFSRHPEANRKLSSRYVTNASSITSYCRSSHCSNSRKLIQPLHG